MGFLRTWIHVPLPLVFGDYLPPERYDQLNKNCFSSSHGSFFCSRFPSGYGLFMFIQGIIMFVFTAIVTNVSNVVKDDIITFHCLELAMALCVVPWMIEVIWLKVKKN